ncbi:hypothetical protein OUZ56_028063 [Daphnia magna]|uniref:Uncharacterized protein n=1 Tax=Daphnia magna TaxID=35525 RepID=A0ABR0B2R1_9CRUS|nr:hypothetical protein OUZ56_028063 [Daphnia magna]
MNPAADVLVRARNDDHLSALSPFLIDISFMSESINLHFPLEKKNPVIPSAWLLAELLLNMDGAILVASYSFSTIISLPPQKFKLDHTEKCDTTMTAGPLDGLDSARVAYRSLQSGRGSLVHMIPQHELANQILVVDDPRLYMAPRFPLKVLLMAPKLFFLFPLPREPLKNEEGQRRLRRSIDSDYFQQYIIKHRAAYKLFFVCVCACPVETTAPYPVDANDGLKNVKPAADRKEKRQMFGKTD